MENKNKCNKLIDPLDDDYGDYDDYDDDYDGGDCWPSGWWIFPIALVVLCGLSVLVAWACSAWGAPAGW